MEPLFLHSTADADLPRLQYDDRTVKVLARDYRDARHDLFDLHYRRQIVRKACEYDTTMASGWINELVSEFDIARQNSEASLLSELKYPQIRLSPQSLVAHVGRFVACHTQRWC
ncbi:MAG TPA: hypothetical protein VK550_32765 [Polyangiaceae bacterium]|nr:hypothetical protein [Polyangiaceae bacterium]